MSKNIARNRNAPPPYPFEDWMIASAYSVAAILPADQSKALTLAKQVVLEMNKSHVARLRRRGRRKAVEKPR
jgi:hypothetical protein